MRKNSIFAILAVILSLTGANADEITSLTLDTPVNWSVSAFNRSIGQYCLGKYSKVSETIVGDVILGHNYDEGQYKPIKATSNDLDENCKNFVLSYSSQFKTQPAMSLRNVIDICMSTIASNQVCTNIAQSLLYYSLGHDGSVALESQILMNNEKLYSEDGKFYVYGQMSYQSINNANDTKDFADDWEGFMEYAKKKESIRRELAPQPLDDGIYLSESNQRVGTCYNAANLIVRGTSSGNMFKAGSCEMIDGYTEWVCYNMGTKLQCANYFTQYQRNVLDNLDGMLDAYKPFIDVLIKQSSESIGAMIEKAKNVEQKQQITRIFNETKDCTKTGSYKILDDAAEDVRNLFNPNQKYSEEKWEQIQKAGNRLMKFDNGVWAHGSDITSDLTEVGMDCENMGMNAVTKILSNE